jgi:type IV pilus assembly protein PilY1
MNSLKRLIASGSIAALLVLPSPATVFADDSDIFGANVQPNVMIFIDDSGSMADSVPSNAYDDGTTYPVLVQCDPVTTKHPTHTTYQNCGSTAVYKQGASSGGSSTYSTYAASVSAVNSAAARSALNSTGYWSGTISGSSVNLFLGNYLNYLNGTCSSGGACLTPKMTVAKNVVNTLVANTTGIRFGLATFYYGNWTGGSPSISESGASGNAGGAQMLAPIGSSVAQIQAKVNALTPTAFTPLGEAVWDMGRYFQGAPWGNGQTYTSPIQLSCQPNFVILVTDGIQNGTLDIKTEATRIFTTDAAPSLSGLQNVILDTVGFGVSVNTSASETAAALSDLKTAAANGGGQFYQADSAQQLEAALQNAIRRITQATYTFATPVVPTTSTTGSTKAYLAAFKSDPSSPFWQGYLKAYQRGSNGLVPVDSNGVPLSSALVWEAGQVLTTIPSANRTIYTVANETTTTNGSTTTGTGSLSPFTTSNSAITPAMLGVPDSTTANQVISFVRGVDVYNNPSQDRAWKLGDIFHSTPVLVTPPVLALADPSYQAFKTAQASRTTVLIAGSNDGMVHAFRETDGVELWAFIPPDVLDDLQNLTVQGGEHGFYMDSSPIAVDIKVSGTWKTIVMFGQRRGGPAYYALDITNTTSPQFLWSFTDSKITETWSEPSMGKVKLGGNDTYVAFFGGGYDTASNDAHGKAFFAIDVSNGHRLWQYYNDGTSDDRQYMNFSLTENSTAVDLNNDGYVDRVYIGDVGGQLWKFDVSANATTSWAGKRLFTAAPSQANPPASGEFYPTEAFYGAPVLTWDTSQNLWVFLGTGDRNHPNNAATNRFYGIMDTTDMTNGAALSESNLANVTSTNASATGGWYFLLGTNQKVLDAGNVFNMDVLFSAFTPTTTVTCTSGGGTAALYSVQMTTGYAAIDFTTGTALTSTGASTTRSTNVGQGIASMPVVIVTPPMGSGSATASAITATTNQQLPSNPIPAPPFLKQVRSWKDRIQ